MICVSIAFDIRGGRPWVRLATFGFAALAVVLGGCGSGPGPVDWNAPKEFTTTESGLKYKILRQTDGRKPDPDDTVKVHYRGWLDGGKEFDSSYNRDQWSVFSLNQVVPAWKEGIPLCPVGGMIELEAPPDLAYGARGRPGIPPNSTLHFLVEVLEIMPRTGP